MRTSESGWSSFAKLALDARVPERRVWVAQQQAHQLGAAFDRALDALANDIPPTTREALRRALGAELRAVVRENEHAKQRDVSALDVRVDRW
ncbi:MAG: hypothetical protein RIB67_10080 [Miltoncostaeaceae bacterium]